MGLSSACRARIVAGPLLLTILALPAASAQALPVSPEDEALEIAILCESAFFEPNYLERDSITCLIRDFSRDSVALPGAPPLGPSIHNVALSVRPAPGHENETGWQVILDQYVLGLRGGQEWPIQVHVTPTPAITTDEYHFELVAEFRAQTGYNRTVVMPMVAQVNPYGQAVLSWGSGQSQKAGQDDVVVYELVIANDGVYPDTYVIDITTHPSLRVSAPPDAYVPAGESRTVYISVLTPRGKLYELGFTTPLLVKVTSVGVGDIPGTGVYSAAATLQVRGAYVPVYWIPLLVVGLVSASLLSVEGVRRAELRREERGRPRPVEVSPRQAVLLAELKRQDRAAYKEKRAALDAVYKERLADYRAHRRERLAADRAEARQARLEFAQQKKARRAQRALDKRARAEARRAERIEAREVKKREKLLAKAKKKLAKAQKKQAKIDAKLAAKQAKIDAKLAKKEAQRAAAAAKAEAKAAKAAAKAAKRSENERMK